MIKSKSNNDKKNAFFMIELMVAILAASTLALGLLMVSSHATQALSKSKLITRQIALLGLDQERSNGERAEHDIFYSIIDEQGVQIGEYYGTCA